MLGKSKKVETVKEPARSAEDRGESRVATGMVVEGNCSTAGRLRVDGKVTGNVRARGLTVGAEGRVEGDVRGPEGGPAEGGVVVEGHVAGSIDAPRLEIGPEGSVGGGLKVDEAVIRGKVTGPIVARTRLMLEASAVVDGDVTAGRLGVQEGGQVRGTIRIGEVAKAQASEPGSDEGGDGPRSQGPGTGGHDEPRPGRTREGAGDGEAGVA